MNYEAGFWTLLACFCLSAIEAGLKVGFEKWKHARRVEERIPVIITTDYAERVVSVGMLKSDRDKLDIMFVKEVK